MKNMKTCTKCKEGKELSCFSKHNQMKSGYRNDCKSCVYQRTKKWVLSNKEKSILAKKEHYKSNCEKIKKLSKKYRFENTEKLKDYHKKYYIENTEKRQLYHKKWGEKNKEYLKEYQKNRRETDPLFKMSGNLRSRTYEAFKNNGYKKNTKTENTLGASYETVKQHLQSQFTEGMEWSNQGLWHIDHIIPLASASSLEELIKLCHYKNLQPLWAEDNMTKNAMLPDEWEDYKNKYYLQL